MGLHLRHIVWFSGALSLGSFVYVLALEPMDPARTPRAAALERTPSRRGLIGLIRRSMAVGQMAAADREADTLLRHFPDDPGAYFYRALLDRQLGRDQAALAMFAKLRSELGSLDSWPNRYREHELDYLRAWARIGVGDAEEGRRLFAELAEGLELRASGENGEVLTALTAYNLACYRAMAGQTDAALAWWSRAVELGYGRGGMGDRGWWKADPDLASLSDRGEFWEIAQPLLGHRDTQADRRGDEGDAEIRPETAGDEGELSSPATTDSERGATID